MVVSAGARNCLRDAKAEVNIVSTDTAEDMFIHATGLPPNTDFDFFVIQVPTAPFGLSWYQGDVKTNHKGEAVQHFRGRFNIETFIFAQGPRAGTDSLQRSAIPGCSDEPDDQPSTDLPFGSLVQFAPRRAKQRLPRHGDALQWRTQCRYPGFEHVEFSYRCRTVAEPQPIISLAGAMPRPFLRARIRSPSLATGRWQASRHTGKT
jgi:hypothetical protein